jgi:hypothetical protein
MIMISSMNITQTPNKGIHSDPKSLSAFGPGDAQRSVYENGNEKVDYFLRTDFRSYRMQPIVNGC